MKNGRPAQKSFLPCFAKTSFTRKNKTGNYIATWSTPAFQKAYASGDHTSGGSLLLNRWNESPVKKIDDTSSFYELDDTEFLRQMAGCRAYADTAGFESICEAMYLGKPILMVPAHIEGRRNAYDGMGSGAGITNEDFNLEHLLKFAETYPAQSLLCVLGWTVEYVILNELEQFVAQDTLQHMYMVEDYI